MKTSTKKGIQKAIKIGAFSVPYVGGAMLLNQLSRVFMGTPFITWEGVKECLLELLSVEL